jgi:hypothetical protein
MRGLHFHYRSVKNEGMSRMLQALVIFLSSVSAPAAEAPFWKSKEKAYERIKNGEILVAVKSGDVKEPGLAKNLLIIQGGGRVGAPADFVYKKALEFDRLGKVSGYIKSAKFNPAAQTLDLVVGAFGFEGKMRMLMKMKPEADPRQIEFLVQSGSMQGLSGTFTFENIGPQKTEVGIDSRFRYDEFPAPRVFLEFGLEVVFQRMAARLRAYVEEEFNKRGP